MCIIDTNAVLQCTHVYYDRPLITTQVSNCFQRKDRIHIPLSPPRAVHAPPPRALHPIAHTRCPTPRHTARPPPARHAILKIVPASAVLLQIELPRQILRGSATQPSQPSAGTARCRRPVDINIKTKSGGRRRRIPIFGARANVRQRKETDRATADRLPISRGR